MPITLPNGSSYKLCLLDTNALSEIVKYPSNEGRGYIERFPPREFIPCFTVYNLIELRRKPKVFRKFVEFFSNYPSFITKPYQDILEAEVAAKGRAKVNDILSYAFTPSLKTDLTKFINNLFNGSKMAKLESEWQNNDQNVLNTWQANKANFHSINSEANARDAKQFVHDASIDTLCQIYPKLVQASIDANNVALLQSFPSLQIMLYGQYYRIFRQAWMTKNKDKNQEVTDVAISACVPYVDAVVTEKFQAGIYQDVHKHIGGMSATIARLRDIRHHM